MISVSDDFKRLIEFEGRPSFSEEQRLAWCDWFRSVGIDPRDVTMDGFVEWDIVHNTISYESFVRSASGGILKNEDGTDAARTVITVALDFDHAPPKFPVL